MYILSCKYNGFRCIYNVPKSIIIFADTNFNYLGETIVSKNNIPYEEINNHIVNYDINNDSIVVNYVHYVFSQQPVDSIKQVINKIVKQYNSNNNCNINNQFTNKKQKNKNEIIKYFNQFNINDKDFSVIVLHKMGCHSCNDYIANTIAINSAILFSFEEKPFYVIYISPGSNKSMAQRTMYQYNIRNKTHTFVDTTYQYNQIYSNSPFYNPRLILVRKNEVIFDRTFLPDELDTAIFKLLDFYNLTMKKKN